jgi:hypothetical protein
LRGFDNILWNSVWNRVKKIGEFLIKKLRSINNELAVSIEVEFGAARLYQRDQGSIHFLIDIQKLMGLR